MGYVDYSQNELETIRSMSREGKTDEQICQAVLEKFGIKRTPKSIARKRGREGIVKLSIQPYIPRVGWSSKEVDFVRDHYKSMTDAEIGLTLSRSESAVLRIRGKHFFSRTELGVRHQEVEHIQPKEDPYQKHYICGGMSDYEKRYVENLKETKGTYGHPTQGRVQTKVL